MFILWQKHQVEFVYIEGESFICVHKERDRFKCRQGLYSQTYKAMEPRSLLNSNLAADFSPALVVCGDKLESKKMWGILPLKASGLNNQNVPSDTRKHVWQIL